MVLPDNIDPDKLKQELLDLPGEAEDKAQQKLEDTENPGTIAKELARNIGTNCTDTFHPQSNEAKAIRNLLIDLGLYTEIPDETVENEMQHLPKHRRYEFQLNGQKYKKDDQFKALEREVETQ